MEEDLDDGELWLPSDIFPEVGVRRNHRHDNRLPTSTARRPTYISDIAYMEDLAYRLAAFGLLDRPDRSFQSLRPNANVQSLPYSEGFRPAARFEVVEREVFAYDGYRHPFTRSATSLSSVPGFGAGSRPVYFNQVKPTPAQVESFAMGRARILQRQQGLGPNRYFPVRFSGSGRERCGTGVFLPRVTTNDVKKKPALNSGEQQEGHAGGRFAVVGGQGMPFQSPPGMGLPQDWTY